DPGSAVIAGVHEATGRVLGLLQQWLADERFEASRLVIVTRNAVSAIPGDASEDLAGAAVWGLVRSAQAENPGRFVLLDLPAGGAVPELDAVLASGESELALRDGTLRAPRLVRASGVSVVELPAGDDPAWKLAPGDGSVDGIRIVPSPEALRELAPGEVRISVRAAGLNFRDAMVSLGMIPGDRGTAAEGSGVVVEAGSDVRELAVGDRVMGLFPEGAGGVVVVDRRLVAGVPSGWSFAEGAAFPIAYLTAFYALCDVAGVRGGESVLVHAG
ncbi:SpnB-like Rossmann fold domain-containing protein, partial [Catenulispora rubra]|uniref:SpnB-like Rossmann fold domain-containing protein n=1 Tax=Catenulispora rubra TaxID=280293 RepID=UPI0018920957